MAQAHFQTLCDHCINKKCPILLKILDNQKLVFKTTKCSEHIDGMVIPDDIETFGNPDEYRTAIATFLKDNPEFDWSDFGF